MEGKNLKFRASDRSMAVKYAIRDILLEAKKVEREGKKIYWLNIGDPLKYDFRTPAHMWEAVEKHKKESESYGPSEGIPEAREAIAKNYKQKGVDTISAENIMLGNGLSEIIWFILGVLANPKENILIPYPTYPLYPSVCEYMEVDINPYYLNEEDKWQPDTDEIRGKINNKTKAIVIINPNNPTGANYSEKILKEIVDISAENNLVILADEAYDLQLLKENIKHCTIAKLAKDYAAVLSMNSLSKNFFATGFRIGWITSNNYLAENSNIMEAILRMGRARICAVHPFQFAVKAALEGPMDFLKENIKKIKERQHFAAMRFNEIEGLSCVEPEATFYALPRIELDNVKNDKEFVLNLLREEGVCTVFGEGFGQKEGTRHFRIVSLPNLEILGEALDKIEKFVKRNYL